MAIGTAALVGWAAGVACGVVSGLWQAEAALLGGLVAAAGLWLEDRRALPVALVCVGLLWGGAARRTTLVRDPGLAAAASRSGPVMLTGVLLTDAVSSDHGVRFDLGIRASIVRVTVGGELAAAARAGWVRGRIVTAPVSLRRPEPDRNPGAATPEWQALVRRFTWLGSVKSAALVDVRAGPWWEEAASRVRARVRQVITLRMQHHPDPHRAVVIAILIGDRSGLDGDRLRPLQLAGVVHVIAISGGNVALLTWGCLGLVRMLTRRTWVHYGLTLALVLAYGLVVGGEPSVIRAVVAAALYLGLRLARLSPRPVTLLVATAAMSLAAWPRMTVDVGAWLSFGATGGLLMVLPGLLRAAAGPHPARRRGLLHWGGVGALATVAVEVVIAPVSAQVFGRVSVAGLVMNLVAIPAMGLVQAAGMVVLFAGDTWPTVGAGSAAVANAGAAVLLALGDAMVWAPWLSWRVPPVDGGWLVAYACALGWAVAGQPRRTRRGGVVLVACGLVVIVTAPLTARHRPPPGWLRVTFLDVGQGDATLVQLPTRRSLLVDAGGAPGSAFDVGGRIVVPAVWALGERRLDWLVLSHGDLDHIGGAGAVIDDLSPVEVWEGIPIDRHEALDAWRMMAGRRRVTWRRLLAGHTLESGPVTLTVRHPPVPDWQRIRVRNDDSLVLEVRFGVVSILLTGDVGPEFEAGGAPIVDPARPPRIRVLKVAHHGSRSSTGAAFLDRFRPHVAVISAGAANPFGHPAPEVLARLAAAGTAVYETGRDGAVSVETDGRRVRVRTWRGGRRDLR